MAGIEVTLTEEEIQGLFRDDRGVAQLLERVSNEVLEAEIADHLGAEPHERSDAGVLNRARPLPTRHSSCAAARAG